MTHAAAVNLALFRHSCTSLASTRPSTHVCAGEAALAIHWSVEVLRSDAVCIREFSRLSSGTAEAGLLIRYLRIQIGTSEVPAPL